MKSADRTKLFHITTALLRHDLTEIERQFGLDLGMTRDEEQEATDAYYLQFPHSIRAQAADMAAYYKLFFCLENSIRDLVADSLLSHAGTTWWDAMVPEGVKVNVSNNIQREQEAGMTSRSPDFIDYTTFGELGQIILGNWDVFSDTFNNRKAVNRVLNSLNLLRGPIAHCSPLASDEALRLQLALRDWFRLME